MSDVFGTVQRIVAKQAGRGTAHNIQMDDGQWYGHGFKQPNFGEGAEISFDVEYNGQYANVIVESVQVINEGQPPRRQQQQGGYNGQRRSNGGGNTRGASGGGRAPAQASGGMSRDKYWENKEKRDLAVQKQIQYQAARNAAIEATKLALEQGAAALPAKKEAKLDALLALIGEITDRFYEDTTDIVRPRDARVARQAPVEESGDENFDDDIPFD